MINKCIIGKINEISSMSSKFFIEKIKDEGLPILQNHMPLFYILAENGSHMLFNEISNKWGISKSSLSDIINKHESQGLIKKCTCSEDKRSVYISLTTKGVDIKQKLQRIEAEFLDILLSNFDGCERQNFEADIDKALKNLKKML